jgi:hypothetical protein
MKNKMFSILALLLFILLTACKDKVSDGSGDIGSVINQEPVEADEEQDQEEEVLGVDLFAQDFEGFDQNRNWFLSDFGLQGERDKEQYVDGSELKFDIRWTRRTRNHLADYFNYTRKEMTHALANSLCEPKIEIGQEHLYTDSDSNNHIAELDTDTSHCGINGTEPAAISIRSFVPTQVGYKYQVKVKYKMRSYNQMTEDSYKNLILRFGGELEKFDPEFDEFIQVKLDMVATRRYSKLVISDNGLPNSFGILIDDIQVSEHGKVDNYDACAEHFSLNSKGFRKCIQGEVNTDQVCNLSGLDNAVVRASKKVNVADNRRDINNIFTAEAAVSGKINFFSLGLKGKVNVSCAIDGHAALMPIYGKTLMLREISWGNANVNSYPELAKVRIKLEDCLDDSLNRTVTLGSVATSDVFSLTFDEDENGRSYEGCKMNKLIIKDITPSGPSTDGFDLNSLQLF